MTRSVSQNQLVLPLVNALADHGGRATTTTLYDAVANRAGIDRDAVSEEVWCGRDPKRVDTFKRSVRWAQQRAKLLGLARPVGDGDWTLTGRGRKVLRTARPGVVVTVFHTENGVALWAAAEDAVQWIEDGSVQLFFTSPPYPLIRQKDYGNVDEHAYVDWLLGVMDAWPDKLTEDGSIVLNLGEAWQKGQPTQSLYQERLLLKLNDELGLNLCQRFQWRNPSKMPAPAEWVTIRRERVKPDVEQCFHLSPTTHPYADNRAILKPYSEAMRKRQAEGGERRREKPSGHAFTDGAFARDNGGAIPGSMIEASNAASNDGYQKACKDHGLPVHPARFPKALADFFIRYLSRPGDLVADPFGGSGTTARAAEDLGRRWIVNDMALEYVQGVRLRF